MEINKSKMVREQLKSEEIVCVFIDNGACWIYFKTLFILFLEMLFVYEVADIKTV